MVGEDKAADRPHFFKVSSELKFLHHPPYTTQVLMASIGSGFSRRSSGDNEPAHYMLKVESFSLLSEAGIDTFDSDTFDSGGYKWRLVLYPNGNTTDEGENHISLYLGIVDTGSLPKSWEVNAYFKFYVYDHVRENYLTIQDADGKKRRFHSMKLEWGFAKLLPLKIFKDVSSGYLFQDSCVFGVEVFVTPKFAVKESCLSMMKPPTTNNSYTWTVENFSSSQGKISSEDFKIGKVKWMLDFYPKGNGSGSGTHLSIYLRVADLKSFTNNSRIYVNFKMRVKDQSGTSHHEWKELSIGHWFCDSSDWGFSNFISLSNLEDEGKNYVVNDKLIIEVEIVAVGAFKTLT